MKEYYAFRIQQLSEGHTLISVGRLLQQYVVDAYCCIERIHLRWIQKYQDRLRIEIYSGLKDTILWEDTTRGNIKLRYNKTTSKNIYIH